MMLGNCVSKALYRKAMHTKLFWFKSGELGFRPYIIVDKLGYPLLPWLLIPHKHGIATPSFKRPSTNVCAEEEMLLETLWYLKQDSQGVTL